MNKTYHVKKNTEIEAILKNKCFKNNKYFSVYKKENSETIHFRYALSVGKKIGNAVIRNSVKRRIRAILEELPIDREKNNDIFIIAKKSILDLSYQQTKEQLEFLLNKLKITKEKNN